MNYDSVVNAITKRKTPGWLLQISMQEWSQQQIFQRNQRVKLFLLLGVYLPQFRWNRFVVLKDLLFRTKKNQLLSDLQTSGDSDPVRGYQMLTPANFELRWHCGYKYNFQLRSIEITWLVWWNRSNRQLRGRIKNHWRGLNGRCDSGTVPDLRFWWLSLQRPWKALFKVDMFQLYFCKKSSRCWH
jgi:hypothetical protein